MNTNYIILQNFLLAQIVYLWQERREKSFVGSVSFINHQYFSFLMFHDLFYEFLWSWAFTLTANLQEKTILKCTILWL